MTDPWKRPTEEETNLDDPKQMKLDFTSSDQKTAQRCAVFWSDDVKSNFICLGSSRLVSSSVGLFQGSVIFYLG